MTKVDMKSLRVLIIDDERFMRQLLRRVLMDLQIEHVEYANNGAEGLEKLEESGGNFDIILCDLDMPSMNGFEFVRHLRESPDYEAHSRVPVLIVSGRSEEESVRDATELGIHGFLVKPITAQVLGEGIQSAMNSPTVDPIGAEATLPSPKKVSSSVRNMTEQPSEKVAKPAAKKSTREALEHKRGFRHMPGEMLDKLLENMVIVKFDEGTAFMMEGIDHPYTYILLKGKMSIIAGDKHIYDLGRTGDVVGEMALVNPGPCTATVRAHGNCEAVQFSKAHLEKIGNAAYYLWISRILSEKLSRTTALLSDARAKIRE